MSTSAKDSSSPSAPATEVAGYLQMPEERRTLAKAHAAMLAETAGRVALQLPFSADVDDFRRVLAEGAKP